jgi:hypothetical protein
MDRHGTALRLALAGLAVLGIREARGDVVEATAGGFTVKTTVAVAAVPVRVFEAFARVGSWWDPEHTYSGNSMNLSIALQPGGCFCERLPPLPLGGVQHATVVLVIPNKTLRLVGALGPLQESAVSGSLTFDLAERAGGTDVTMTYAVGGYRPGGLDTLAPVVDSVLAAQLRRFKGFVEKGVPTP